MTPSAGLRAEIAARLKAGLDVAAHCLVMADACEEEGDVPGAEFWRLVGAKKVWPRAVEWRKFVEWWWQEVAEPYCYHEVKDRRVFSLLGKETLWTFKTWHGRLRLIKRYYSVCKAILSLEHAWRSAP